MGRRRTERPVERLRSSWTSTADLEETIAAMFHVSSDQPEAKPAAPAAPFPALESTETKLDIESPTGVVSDVPTGGEPDTPTGDTIEAVTVGISETPTGDVLETPPIGEAKPAPVGASEMPTAGVLETPTGDISEPPETIDMRRIRLRPVRTVQDGLTPGEFLLLTQMFKAAAAQAGSEDRILQGAGYRTLSERTGQDPKTVKRNRISLAGKFCIEPIGQNTFTEAAQFRIFHFDTILAGWRRRGLVWVRRAGRSVELQTGGGIAEPPPVGTSAMPPVGDSELPTVGTP
jgi:hypothetical protein